MDYMTFTEIIEDAKGRGGTYTDSRGAKVTVDACGRAFTERAVQHASVERYVREVKCSDAVRDARRYMTQQMQIVKAVAETSTMTEMEVFLEHAEVRWERDMHAISGSIYRQMRNAAEEMGDDELEELADLYIDPKEWMYERYWMELIMRELMDAGADRLHAEAMAVHIEETAEHEMGKLLTESGARGSNVFDNAALLTQFAVDAVKIMEG